MKALEEEGPEDSVKAGVVLGKIVCTDGIPHQEYPRLRPRGSATETCLRALSCMVDRKKSRVYNQRLSVQPETQPGTESEHGLTPAVA